MPVPDLLLRTLTKSKSHDSILVDSIHVYQYGGKMSLREELQLYREIETKEHECVMSIMYTSTLLYKIAYKYFSGFNITESQFNSLMQLKYSEKEGMSQIQLSRRLLVNKAEVTGLVDRMEKAKLVERLSAPSDRRVKIIKITKKGLETVKTMESGYFNYVNKVMGGLGKKEIENMVQGLQSIRKNAQGVN